MKYSAKLINFDTWKNQVLLQLFEQPIKNYSAINIEYLSKAGKKDSLDRLRGLWYLLLKTLSQDTGYSELYFKKLLKTKANFFVSIKEPDGKVTRDYRSVSAGECDMESLSGLFTEAFEYIKENEVIDTRKFEDDYMNITGKSL